MFTRSLELKVTFFPAEKLALATLNEENRLENWLRSLIIYSLKPNFHLFISVDIRFLFKHLQCTSTFVVLHHHKKSSYRFHSNICNNFQALKYFFRDYRKLSQFDLWRLAVVSLWKIRVNFCLFTFGIDSSQGFSSVNHRQRYQHATSETNLVKKMIEILFSPPTINVTMYTKYTSESRICHKENSTSHWTRPEFRE